MLLSADPTTDFPCTSDRASRSLLDQLGFLLATAECPACVRLREQGLGACADCDEGLDIRESVAGRGDRVNFLGMQSAFGALERGTARIESVVCAVRSVQHKARCGVSSLVRVLSNNALSPPVREVCEEARDSQQTLDRMLEAFLLMLQRGDTVSARRELSAVRLHMQNMDALQLRTSQLVQQLGGTASRD